MTKVVTAMNREEGLFEIQARAVILAMGCRERSGGAEHRATGPLAFTPQARPSVW